MGGENAEAVKMQPPFLKFDVKRKRDIGGKKFKETFCLIYILWPKHLEYIWRVGRDRLERKIWKRKKKSKLIDQGFEEGERVRGHEHVKR